MGGTKIWLAMAAATLLVTWGCDKEAPAPAEPSASSGEPATEPAPAPAEESEGPAEEAEAPEEAPAKAEPSKPTEQVVLWHAYRAKEKDAIEQVVKTYNESQSEVKIRIQAVPYDPFVDKVTITVPRGQGPDLFIFAHNMIGSWVEDGILEPLGTRVQPDELKQFLPQSVKALVYQKNLYGLPLAFKSLALFYNKKLLPEPPATMEELLVKLKEIQSGNKGKPTEQHVYGMVYEASLLYFHAPWIHAFGGSVFDAEGNPALDTEGQKEAAEFARALHLEHKVLPKGMSGYLITSLFNKGQVATSLNGPWFRSDVDEGVDYGVAMIPTIAGKTPKPFLGIEAVFVSAKSEHKDAAIKAARYLAGEASAQVRMDVGKQPVTNAKVLAGGGERDPVVGVFSRQAEQAVIMPSQPEMQLVWSTADTAINGVIFAGKDADEAFKRAQAKVVEDISKRGR